MRILKQSDSAEKLERGDPLVFLKLQFALLQNIKKLEGGTFSRQKNFEENVA